MTDISSIQQKWDNHYSDAELGAPSKILMENAHLLPQSGEALEIACGMGANAVFMARHGLHAHAWDISKVAIDKLQTYAFDEKLALIAQIRDVTQDPPAEKSFDVIVVSHYLERSLIPSLIKALNPGGLLVYQTFSKSNVDGTGPRNSAFRLGDNEMLGLCSDLRLVVYREEQAIGDVSQGNRNLVYYIGQRRA